MKKCTTMLLALVAVLLLLPGMARAADASGTCGEGLTWTLEGGVLTIEGTGAMEDYGTDGAPWYDYHGEIQSIEIGSGVTYIGAGAFYNCNKATSVTIPEGVTYIGTSAFESCRSLVSISLPDSLRRDDDEYWSSYRGLGDSVFKDCRKLASIEIPCDVGSSAFVGCSALRSVTIGEGVRSIGNYVFQGCTSLTDLTINEGITYIGWDAFADCTGLSSVALPESLARINSGIFRNCTSLISASLPSGLTTIDHDVFSGCSGLTDITLPKGLMSIGSNAFSGCSSLKSLAIPNSVTKIDYSAFSSCRGLLSINIPNRLTDIASSTFYGCSGLTEIEIPDSVVTIGNGAFGGCTGLTEIEIPDSVISIDGAFSGCAGLTRVVIPDSVTSMDGAFWGCTSLASIDIPDYVTSIEGAFSGCTSLTELVIPDRVTSIGANTFYGCTSLESITIPVSVTEIGQNATYNCTSLTDVYYSGSKSQWKAITIDNQWSGNAPLLLAAIHCTDGDIIPVRGVTLLFSEVQIAVGETLQLPVELLPANADNQNLTWTSYVPEIVSVSPSGLVTAHQRGNARINVETEEGGYRSYCNVYVTENPRPTVTLLPNNDLPYGSPYTEVMDPGAQYTLPECNFPAPEGKVFSHWEMNGSAYAPGDTITVTGNVGIKAMWKKQGPAPVMYTVSFLSNGGTGDMTPAEIEEGMAYVLPACGFTPPEGQKFSHWEIGGKSYSPGARITVTGNLTAKAVYSEQSGPSFTFEFDFSQMDVSNGTLTLGILVYMDGTFLLTIPVVLSLS